MGSVGISVGGKSRVVEKGSGLHKQLLSQGGVESAQAKTERNTYLKSLNKPGSPNYRYEGFGTKERYEAAKAKGVLEEGKLTPEDVTAFAGKQPIDTTQPSPQNVQTGIAETAPTTTTAPITQGITSYDQAMKGLQTSGQPQGDIAKASEILKQKYGQGFQQAMASGIPAPSTQGEALSTIQQTSEQFPQQQDTSIVDTYMQEDEGIQGLKQMYADYYGPENQKTSLMDTYNQLFKNSGLEKLDKDIIDAQTIIDGTEDDIRNEIEQAGGFGTDSQVQALSLSRNKVLLKNYNNLVALRQSKQQSLD